eukprot:TRINITY_DN3991_c0_g1_i3.p1 TRINITY_DN3991_c0_g1~~TRINITY_DN3991_c0_g1_i3.p1  ORF type:complete len:193 (-),score=28.78 TRINITY_DN3991_c0_g1_i3:81-659(-)
MCIRDRFQELQQKDEQQSIKPDSLNDYKQQDQPLPQSKGSQLKNIVSDYQEQVSPSLSPLLQKKTFSQQTTQSYNLNKLNLSNKIASTDYKRFGIGVKNRSEFILTKAEQYEQARKKRVKPTLTAIKDIIEVKNNFVKKKIAELKNEQEASQQLNNQMQRLQKTLEVDRIEQAVVSTQSTWVLIKFLRQPIN